MDEGVLKHKNLGAWYEILSFSLWVKFYMSAYFTNPMLSNILFS